MLTETYSWQPILETGKIEPKIYEVFPLKKAPEAHRLMESGTHIGKIVLDLSNLV